MRCFYAISISEEAHSIIRNKLEIVKDKIQARWLPEEGWHITILFLGELNDSGVEIAKEALGNLKPITHNLELKLKDIDYLKGFQSGKIVVHISEESLGNPALNGFKKGLADYLIRKGVHFKESRNKLLPHISLGRFKALNRNQTPIIKTEINKVFVPEKITLFESKLSSGGATYREVVSKNLHGK